LERGGSKILAVLPQLIIPIKSKLLNSKLKKEALGTKSHEIMCATLKKL